MLEDCGVEVTELEARFGPDVARLVDGVTKLTRMDFRPPGAEANGAAAAENLYAESLRKMLVAMAEDIRVVLIKLADRLHNMRTLDALSEGKRRRIAQETLDVYSPLAHRLGIWELKWQLDDLAFRYLNEGRYREISRMLAARRSQREAYVADVPTGSRRSWPTTACSRTCKVDPRASIPYTTRSRSMRPRARNSATSMTCTLSA